MMTNTKTDRAAAVAAKINTDAVLGAYASARVWTSEGGEVVRVYVRTHYGKRDGGYVAITEDGIDVAALKRPSTLSADKAAALLS